MKKEMTRIVMTKQALSKKKKTTDLFCWYCCRKHRDRYLLSDFYGVLCQKHGL